MLDVKVPYTLKIVVKIVLAALAGIFVASIMMVLGVDLIAALPCGCMISAIMAS